MRPVLLMSVFTLAVSRIASGQADTAKKSPAVPAAADSSDEGKGTSIGAGISAGQLRFPKNAQERALGATIATHLWGWVDLSVNPTYASATAADTTIGKKTIHGRTASGFAPLPFSIGVSHDLPGDWSPSFSVGVGFSLPTGDSLSVGYAPSAGYGLNLGFGLSPSDNFSVDFGASHALNSAYSTGIGNSSSTSLSASTTVTAGKVGISGTYSGDVGGIPLGYESAQTLGGGLSIPLHKDLALTLDGSAGLTPGAPTWSSSIGIGFTPSGVASAMLSPIRRARAAFGTGGKITKVKPKTRKSG